MKNFLPKMFAALAIILLLPACFGGDEEDSAKIEEETKTGTESSEVVVKKKEVPKIFYVSEKLSECETIFFTCPQGRAFFTDKKGCGCRESSESYNPNERGLGNMIRDHLARGLIKPTCDGGVFAEFVYIDESVTESGDLNYDVWAVAREFCPEGGTGATFDGPVAFAIEQAEFNRVVRGFTLPLAADENAIRAVFTEKAAEWVLAKENTMRDQMITELEGNIQSRLDKLQNRLEADRKARELAEQSADSSLQSAEGNSGDEENTDVPLENVEKAENSETNCAQEGEKFSKVFTDEYPENCCSGLMEWASGMDTRKVENGECTTSLNVGGSPVGTCLNCGNGVCEEIENICNCPGDCNETEIYCDAVNPCPEGKTCYKFEDEKSPICWEGDDPCAKCASGMCVIAESYPEQIRCQ